MIDTDALGVEGGVDWGVAESVEVVDILLSFAEAVLALWKGEAIVVAAVETRSTGNVITFLNAAR